ncbi:MAG: hypothetical protein ABSB00_00445 [Minisyncoccia bacterium]|jgi:hypothetical protein
MTLRSQSKGGQKPWKLEELKTGLEEFSKVNGHYPTGPEVDRYEYLPSARSVERRFGGLVALRKQLGLGGQNDYRTGTHSIERAVRIGKRAHMIEREVYEFLCKRFGRELVHREYFFTDDARTRADFFVYDCNGNFCIDVFYPSDRRNLAGCLNSKLHKYASKHMRKYPIIFLQMNPELSQSMIDELVGKKEIKPQKGQQVMEWESFKVFCANRKPQRLR